MILLFFSSFFKVSQQNFSLSLQFHLFRYFKFFATISFQVSDTKTENYAEKVREKLNEYQNSTKQNKYHEMFSRPAASATINLRLLARDLSRANNRRNSVNKEKNRYQPRHKSFQNNGGNRVQVDVARFFKNDA